MDMFNLAKLVILQNQEMKSCLWYTMDRGRRGVGGGGGGIMKIFLDEHILKFASQILFNFTC